MRQGREAAWELESLLISKKGKATAQAEIVYRVEWAKNIPQRWHIKDQRATRDISELEKLIKERLKLDWVLIDNDTLKLALKLNKLRKIYKSNKKKKPKKKQGSFNIWLKFYLILFS